MPRRNSASARNGRAGGRPQKRLEDRKAFHGKVAIRIDLDTAALAQRMMLHFPDQPNVESLFAYALRKLAEHTDD